MRCIYDYKIIRFIILYNIILLYDMVNVNAQNYYL